MLSDAQKFLILEIIQSKATSGMTTFNIYNRMLWMIRNNKVRGVSMEQHDKKGLIIRGKSITPKQIGDFLQEISKENVLRGNLRRGKYFWTIGDPGCFQQYKQSVNPSLVQKQFTFA